MSRFQLLADDGLKWYRNDLAARGFCSHCGSNLFWKPEPEDGAIRIMAGCLQADNGLSVVAHIFVQEMSDFQQIAGDAPQHLDWRHNVEIPD